MQLGNYDVQAPMLLGGEMGEAEALGAAVWLWMHSKMHRETPLYALPDLLLPAIKRQQYAIASRNGQPVFYLSWMWLNTDAEHRYLTQSPLLLQESDWASGERMWLRDFIAPFGDLFPLRRLVTRALFPERCFRSLYHRGDSRGLCVMNFHGDNITASQAKAWRAATPLSARVKQR